MFLLRTNHRRGILLCVLSLRLALRELRWALSLRWRTLSVSFSSRSRSVGLWISSLRERSTNGSDVVDCHVSGRYCVHPSSWYFSWLCDVTALVFFDRTSRSIIRSRGFLDHWRLIGSALVFPDDDDEAPAAPAGELDRTDLGKKINKKYPISSYVQ